MLTPCAPQYVTPLSIASAPFRLHSFRRLEVKRLPRRVQPQTLHRGVRGFERGVIASRRQEVRVQPQGFLQRRALPAKVARFSVNSSEPFRPHVRQTCSKFKMWLFEHAGIIFVMQLLERLWCTISKTPIAPKSLLCLALR